MAKYKLDPIEKKTPDSETGNTSGADSLKMTNDEIVAAKARAKGKKMDPTKPGEEKLKKLVGNYLVPKINEHKATADSIYNANKAKDPNYPGVSAKELDPHTGGRGADFIAHTKAYQDYRDFASPASQPNLKPTPQGEKRSLVLAPMKDQHTATQSANTYEVSQQTEPLYVPDERMGKPEKKPLVIKKTFAKKGS